MTVSRLPHLHLVTNDAILRRPGFAERAADLLQRGGSRMALHLRGPDTSGQRIWQAGRSLRSVSGETGGWLIVNDRIDIARGIEADGVQLGRRSIQPADARALLPSPCLIGSSVHTIGEAENAVAGGADFLLAGTLYPSATHPAGPTTGLGWIRDAARLGRPIIGIGGIDLKRCGEVLEAGAYGVAVISAVWDDPEPAEALEKLIERMEGA